ncbi:MAG: hypothetical protein RIM72_00690 [Alphaproteobacteria bacterium]
MTDHHYVRDGAILASSPGPILGLIEEDFQTRFSRDFFHLPATGKMAFNVYEEALQGSASPDDFNTVTDTGPVWNGTAVVRTLGTQTRNVADIKARLRQTLTRTFVRYRDSGVTVSLGKQSVEIDTRPGAQQEVAALVRRLERVGGTQSVCTRSGAIIEADLPTAQALFIAVEDHVANAWSNDAALGSAIDAATTAVALREIDLTAGWPGQ